jgi:hypothetical protein
VSVRVLKIYIKTRFSLLFFSMPNQYEKKTYYSQKLRSRLVELKKKTAKAMTPIEADTMITAGSTAISGAPSETGRQQQQGR